MGMPRFSPVIDGSKHSRFMAEKLVLATWLLMRRCAEHIYTSDPGNKS
jgi:hypothetical protein